LQADVIALVVLWRLRYKLSLRDLPEMFAVRGIVFSYEAVREWEGQAHAGPGRGSAAAPARHGRPQLVRR
jgi:transposase-like protein